jgi:NADH-dependent peroxiredoxin subunit C
MITINQPIENFTLEAYQDEKIKKISLKKYWGKKGKWTVLFFYPADFTFVCPTELGELADNYAEFKKMGVEILSVSTDTVYVHKAWHDQSPIIKKIDFPMLADPTAKLAKYFGVYLEDEGVALRGTFIIDPDGVLKAYEINNNDIGRSSVELIRKLQAAKFTRDNGGEVCPASWSPGKKTLKPGLKLVGKI